MCILQLDDNNKASCLWLSSLVPVAIARWQTRLFARSALDHTHCNPSQNWK